MPSDRAEQMKEFAVLLNQIREKLRKVEGYAFMLMFILANGLFFKERSGHFAFVEKEIQLYFHVHRTYNKNNFSIYKRKNTS